MRKLEVIVISAFEAKAAAKGGADRVELVRDLDSGGLTPSFETVQAVTNAVSIPVRVMLRGNATMMLADSDELDTLLRAASQFERLALDGLVMGWISAKGRVDLPTIETLLAAAPSHRVTFHRAFEHLADPFDGLKQLKRFKQIDRILTCGGPGSWAQRKQRLLAWSRAAAPEIKIIVGGGLSDAEVDDLMSDCDFPEVHIGRVARTPQQNTGAIDPVKIASIKSRRIQ